MLCDRVLYNLHARPAGEAPGRSFSEDTLPLQWFDLHARAVRARTAGGRRVDLLLPLGVGLRDGDVVYEDDAVRIVVRVEPVEVLVIRPADARQMAMLAAELGNLHLPLEVTETELLTPNDGPAVGVLMRYGLPPVVERRVFHPMRALALTAPKVAPALTIRRSTR